MVQDPINEQAGNRDATGRSRLGTARSERFRGGSLSALKRFTLLALALGVALPSCGQGERTGSDEKTPATNQLAVLAAYPPTADVTGVEFWIDSVSCEDGSIIPGSERQVEYRPLEDQLLPGTLSAFRDQPLDEFSGHLFADLFVLLPPGCYDVTTIPTGANGERSRECAPAFKKRVQVQSSETVEVFLINQCNGADPGGLDIIAALNSNPQLLALDFEESKFTCGGSAEVCAIAVDHEDDPLLFELSLSGEQPAPCYVYPTGYPTRVDDGYLLCWDVACERPGEVDLSLVVRDQLWVDGELVTFEQWLEAEGYPNESRATLNFHAYFDEALPYQSYPGYCPVVRDGWRCLERDRDGECSRENPNPTPVP
jgi:hypothetical protein